MINETITPIEISVQDVKELIASNENCDYLLLDCREPHEYEICNINGAKLIPMNQIPEKLSELGDKSVNVITYCHHGGRSLRVTQFLRENGFLNAQNMTGGIDRWAIEIDQSIRRY